MKGPQSGPSVTDRISGVGRARWAWVLGALALGTGLWARLAGLGGRPLAVDEYYFLLSIQSILTDWLPDLPGGGYYVRGILIQYLTAGAIAVTGDTMLGLRIVPTLFGLGSVVLGFIYGTQVGDRRIGFCLAALLLVSSWEVEFSRFGRMYAPLQFFTLLFLVGYVWTMDGRQGWRRYVAPVAALLAVGTHGLGVLLVPLLFVPALLPARVERFGARRMLVLYGLVACATAVVCVAWQFGFADGLREGGLPDRFPADYSPPQPTGASGPWIVPPFPFWQAAESPLHNLFLMVGAAGAVAAALFGWQKVRGEVRAAPVIAAAAVVASLWHQLALAGLLGLILILHYRPELLDRRSRSALLGLGAAASISIAWLGYAALSTYGWGDRSWIGRAGERLFSQAVYATFFAWPDFWTPTLAPWIDTVPVLTAVLLAAFLASAWWVGERRTAEALSHPAAAVLYMAVLFGILRQQYHETRYWFFLYPSMIAVLLLAGQQVAERIRRSGWWAGGRDVRAGIVGLGAASMLFSVTEDFNPLHLARVATAEVAYRTDDFQRYETQWYAREDIRSPSEFVNDNFTPVDPDASIIVADVPQASYYLNMPHAIFYPRHHDRFRNVSRLGGTVDFWSGQRLLSTDDELRQYTRRSSVVLVLRRAEERFQRFPAFDIEGVWGDRLGAVDRLYVSEDGAVEILRLELRPPTSP